MACDAERPFTCGLLVHPSSPGGRLPALRPCLVSLLTELQGHHQHSERQTTSKQHQRFLILMWSNLSTFSFVACHTFLAEKMSLVTVDEGQTGMRKHLLVTDYL